jgi:hypothetical protein
MRRRWSGSNPITKQLCADLGIDPANLGADSIVIDLVDAKVQVTLTYPIDVYHEAVVHLTDPEPAQ